ncbi:MAG: homoserine kinase [Alphaproteobacteria bacterium]|nr:MAG: homoserine kinase [Alphaproteobacteria bacterium]
MAVYTPVSDAAAAAFLADYDLGSLVRLVPIAEGVENSNFLAETTTGPLILTLYEKRVDPADLPFFLGLMEHLAARGVRCPLPVRARDGTALRELAGRPAAIVSFLDGKALTTGTVDACRQVGGALARLHRAGTEFALTRANALSVAGWQDLVARTSAGADGVAPGLGAEVASALAVVAERWPTTLPMGVIHADLFPDNVFFDAGQLTGLIDFYFACTDALAYDVAVCLNAWCFEAPDWRWNPDKAAALLQGYEAARPLSEGERQALPILATGAALRFLLTRLYDWINHPPGALVTPKDPLEYRAKLRFFRETPAALPR